MEGKRERIPDSETDPNVEPFIRREGQLPAYNIQTAVDDRHHLIVSFETTNANTDQVCWIRWPSRQKGKWASKYHRGVADKAL